MRDLIEVAVDQLLGEALDLDQLAQRLGKRYSPGLYVSIKGGKATSYAEKRDAVYSGGEVFRLQKRGGRFKLVKLREDELSTDLSIV